MDFAWNARALMCLSRSNNKRRNMMNFRTHRTKSTILASFFGMFILLFLTVPLASNAEQKTVDTDKINKINQSLEKMIKECDAICAVQKNEKQTDCIESCIKQHLEQNKTKYTGNLNSACTDKCFETFKKGMIKCSRAPRRARFACSIPLTAAYGICCASCK